MHIGWGQETETRVMMLIVVPGEKGLRPCPSISLAAEASRIIRAILKSFELRFRVGIVIGDMRARMGFRPARVAQKRRGGLGGHRPAAIGMQGELPALNTLPSTSLCDQFFCQRRGFAFGDHPTDHIAAEHVQNDIQVVIRPFGRTQQFGDIPAPQLVGRGGQQFWLRIIGVTQLVAAFPHFVIFSQNPVHAAPGADITPFIQQRRIDFTRRTVHKPLTVEFLADSCLLSRREGAWGNLRGARFSTRLPGTVQAAARHTQGSTGGLQPDPLGHVFRLLHQSVSFFDTGLAPTSCATFFWTSMISSARSNSSFRRWFSRCKRASSATLGSTFGPRRCPANPFRLPRSRCSRHLLTNDEYSPSRRNSDPTSPFPLHSSSSRRIRSL